jgi:hypothetical protein
VQTLVENHLKMAENPATNDRHAPFRVLFADFAAGFDLKVPRPAAAFRRSRDTSGPYVAYFCVSLTTAAPIEG